MKKILLSCIAATMVAWIGCESRDSGQVIARVGTSVLTLDDLFKSIPPEYSDHITREHMISYVKQWIDTELLYQEALRRRIEKEPEIKNRLEKMKRDLLSAEIISRSTVVGADKKTVTPQDIESYYQKHKDDFARNTAVAKYVEIVVDDAKTAWQVRNQITDENFLDLAARYSTVPVEDPRSAEFISIDRLPKEIGAVIEKTKLSGTSVPIEMGDGYHIIRVVDKQDAGSISSLDEVREEIVGTLATESQKQDIEDLLSSLRLKTDLEYHFEKIPGAGDARTVIDGDETVEAK